MLNACLFLLFLSTLLPSLIAVLPPAILMVCALAGGGITFFNVLSAKVSIQKTNRTC